MVFLLIVLSAAGCGDKDEATNPPLEAPPKKGGSASSPQRIRRPGYCILDAASTEHQNRLNYFGDSAPCIHVYTEGLWTRVGVKVEDPAVTDTFIYDVHNDILYAIGKNRVFKNTSIRHLPKGHTYNYVITAQGQENFGLIPDAWEYGVKHLHLAQDQDALAAGELKMDENSEYTWNLFSGSITWRLFSLEPGYSVTLEKQVERLFSSEMQHSGNFVYHPLLTDNLPSPEEKQSLCNFEPFKNNNPRRCQSN